MKLVSHLDRSALRIVLAGLVAAVAVALAGWGLERYRLGASDADVFARLERHVLAQLDETSRVLERMGRQLAAQPGLLADAVSVRTSVTGQQGQRKLFDAVDAAIREAGGDPALALTVYGLDGQPLAWSGRPSELQTLGARGDAAALFVTPSSLGTPSPLVGLRLVYLVPVFDASHNRLGSVASEYLLSARRGLGAPVDEPFTLQTYAGPVLLRLPWEGAGETRDRYSFLFRSPSGEALLQGFVSPQVLGLARARWNYTIAGLVLAVLALTVLVLIGPILEARSLSRRPARHLAATGAIAACLLLGWALLVTAGRFVAEAAPVFVPFATGAGGGLLQTPFDLLLGGLLLLGLVALAFDASERWRLRARRDRRPSSGNRLWFLTTQVVAAAAFSALLVGYQIFLRNTFNSADVDVLHFSVQPGDSARLMLMTGLLLFHAAVLWSGVLLFRFGLVSWRHPRHGRGSFLPGVVWLGTFGAVTAVGVGNRLPVPWPATALAFVAVVIAGQASRYLTPRYRHASQGLRLIVGFVLLVLPSLVMYPTLANLADHYTRNLVETNYAAEVMNQREEVQTRLQYAMSQVDRMRALRDLLGTEAPQAGEAPPSGPAFSVWINTDLAKYRVASAVELYGADGSMLSRFALNLPELNRAILSNERWTEPSCDWVMYEEVEPIGSEERTLLKAGRRVCTTAADGETSTAGSIVMRVMLDYGALPFLSSQSPYYELLRTPEERRQQEQVPVGVDLTVYGWSRMAIYTSGSAAWPLEERTFARIYQTRSPFWTQVESRGSLYHVYLMNDRGGIYAVGYPAVSAVGHLVNLAELATLGGLVYLLLLGGASIFSLLGGHRTAGGRALLNEIRASFYRKLFLAFVAVSVVPILTLAFVVQAYIGGRLRADTEAAAVKTADVAQRVIQDQLVGLSFGGRLLDEARSSRSEPSGWRRDQAGAEVQMAPTDDLMVAVGRRVINQDVNIFDGPKLKATSERDLFESQLLPVRTPADVYRAIVLEHRSSFVGEERSGELPYMLAAAPVRVGDRYAILTVPLMLRQQEIEREIVDLNRRVVLATLLFILIGAAIGYPMAERIADPVNRLTRATRRIARGEFDARIAATSSDELRRLVEAFNSMAADLQRQRIQLERTHRLEAWAEMARQVAHEIKNPLTPIQLSAEHLQRVHSDRGRPLSPVLDDCIASILTQVRLLRQISAEFSSFASSPVARPAVTDAADLVEEVLGPYRSGLAGRIVLSTNLPASLPPLFVDRTLVGRALSNVIENALHAMPGAGSLTIDAGEEAGSASRVVRLAITDTGIGMDPDALSRLFEPYFSTKATGTGLGLAIAKRNIELNGGTIRVESEKGKGTTVILLLPAATAGSAREAAPLS